MQDGPKKSGLHLEFRRRRREHVRRVKPALAVVVATVPIGPGDDVVMVAAIQIEGGGLFLEVVEVGHLAGPVLGLAQDGQQQRREDANNGDDHQQFDQGESPARLV